MRAIVSKINPHQWKIIALVIVAFIACLGAYASSRFRIPYLVASPFALVIVLQLLTNYKPIFYLMIAAIPLSVPLESGSLSTDLVSEPLMWVLFVIFLLNIVSTRQFSVKGKLKIFHLLIFLIICWLVITTITSEYKLRSAKFVLAKLWYIVAGVYMADHLLKAEIDIRRLFWSFFIPLCMVIMIITIRHAQEQFSFEESHTIVIPFFANGVIYGATLALFFPFAVLALRWYTIKSFEWYVILAGIVLIIIGIILSFKRGAWLASGVLPFIALLMYRNVLVKTTYAVLVLLGLGLAYLIQDNTFYLYAPTYDKTIWHEGDLSGHLEATFEGKEISGMERFYRWVAAKNMIAAKPVFGTGPSTFNQVYKRYADDAFRTYVSDNEEQSTTHNYFLMTYAEQGIIGGSLFLFLCVFMFLKGAAIFKYLSTQHKIIMLMAILSLSTILLHSALNEMIEVDKVGIMFWVNLVIIHKVESWHYESIQA